MNSSPQESRPSGETLQTLLGQLKTHIDMMRHHEAKADEIKWKLRQLLPLASPLLDWANKQ